MTFKGVFSNGVVILEEPSGLRDGEIVEVVPAKRRRSSRATARATKTTEKPRTRKRVSRAKAPLPGFGAGKDRPDWKGKTTLEIAAELRKRAMGRFGG